jgi:CheY-like chemotaxis protein
MTTSQPLLKQGVQLKSEIAPHLPPVFSDQDKVKQILLNLLSNAAKFTHEGEIVTNCRWQVASEEPRDTCYKLQEPSDTPLVTRHSNLLIEVSDTGIGMTAEQLGRVFEQFQQADASTTRQYGGTGLGLSISKHLAQLLGGDLTATSVEGQGSTFTLTLPLRYVTPDKTHQAATPADRAPATPDTAPAAPGWPPASRHSPLVLAIDDNPDVAAILQQNLSEEGYTIAGAQTAEQGLAMAHELHPAAITLDIILPDRDGWQVLHDLKSDPATRDIPVIMLTIVDNKPMGLRLGAADYLVKPIDSDALLASLQRMAPMSGQPRKLLVVDDDPNVHEMVRQLLENKPYTITSALDGIEALTKVEQALPDAILLDLMLPRLDGFGLLAELRRSPDAADIPVIIITAKSLSEAETTVLQTGAQQVLQKQGLQEETLLRLLQQILHREKTR